MRPTVLVVLAVVAPVVLTEAVKAEELFHKGGTGNCQGCHTTPPQLIRSDAGSTCLSCHQAPPGVTLPAKHYVATDPQSVPSCVQLPPGGDFCWLKKNYKWSSPPGTAEEISSGERHGHSVVAVEYGYMANTKVPVAPGGSYPSTSLTCISCHDPHGNYRRQVDGSFSTSGPPVVASGSYSNSPDPTSSESVGSYRMLGGKGYQPHSLPGVPPFVADPPAAVSPPLYNRSERVSDTRVAYGSGMSEWCQNCHLQMSGNHLHPAGKGATFSREVTDAYNRYIASGNFTGRQEKSYTSLVPYEMGTSDYRALKTAASMEDSVRTGPAGGENVMCLSCHRAHATAWDNMTRWNTSSDFIVYDGRYPGMDNGAPSTYAQGRMASETESAFYGRSATDFALFQRSLCNKCHTKD